ncbi:hypothetical protein [Longitalea luteola]|nr:hypothetical protein [Longitalea luteola]
MESICIAVLTPRLTPFKTLSTCPPLADAVQIEGSRVRLSDKRTFTYSG